MLPAATILGLLALIARAQAQDDICSKGLPVAEGLCSGGEIPGIAGVDYPIYGQVPRTNFRCDSIGVPGYYADPEAACQAFYICGRQGKGTGFLCPNGTLFNQEFLVCDWWTHVDCTQATNYYPINQQILAEMEAANERLGVNQRERERLAGINNYKPNAILGTSYPYNQFNRYNPFNNTNPLNKFSNNYQNPSTPNLPLNQFNPYNNPLNNPFNDTNSLNPYNPLIKPFSNQRNGDNPTDNLNNRYNPRDPYKQYNQFYKTPVTQRPFNTPFLSSQRQRHPYGTTSRPVNQFSTTPIPLSQFDIDLPAVSKSQYEKIPLKEQTGQTNQPLVSDIRPSTSSPPSQQSNIPSYSTIKPFNDAFAGTPTPTTFNQNQLTTRYPNGHTFPLLNNSPVNIKDFSPYSTPTTSDYDDDEEDFPSSTPIVQGNYNILNKKNTDFSQINPTNFPTSYKTTIPQRQTNSGYSYPNPYPAYSRPDREYLPPV